MRQVDFRYVLMRGGADLGELQALSDQAPSVRMDDGGEIKTSLSGIFLPSALANFLTDEIRPELIVDGVAHSLGVYSAATVTEQSDESSLALRIEAYDRCWIVKDNYTETILSIAAGTNYLTAVKQLLTAAGIGTVIETPTAQMLAETREDWDVGTSYLKIINDLLGEINYKQLWFNAQGAAVLEPAYVPTIENVQHTLDANSVQSLMLPENDRQTDVYNAPNVFLCICSNPDKSAPLTSIAVNDNPQSPLSVPRRGRRIMRVENVDNVASQQELDDYAARLRNESVYAGETISVTTALLPGFGVDDITALVLPDLSAICKERRWQMELAVGGSMKHELERVVLTLG